MRFFNTAGPVDCERHYCLLPLERLNLNQVLTLIEQQKYFVLYAPRGTGKTSSLLALMDYLNVQGRYRCVYISVQSCQSAKENVAEAMHAMLSELAFRANIVLNDHFIEGIWTDVLAKSGPYAAFGEV